ncbi:uncharacterized protein LOC129587807 [Paramacrobiotus metropolitanus]|uniref:uncharacterized protein LOC129587807 n=1 Tax=Paramacrobiotus metropolitanus TaxID=2943436 RepID=UPI0024461C7B|nr:uncharacterized protein LOC129587807 [Paramacrobiotus metropolitanus]
MALSLPGSEEGSSVFDDTVALVPQDPSLVLPVGFCSSTDFFNFSSSSLEVDTFLNQMSSSENPMTRRPRGRPKGTTWAAGYKVSGGRPKKGSAKDSPSDANHTAAAVNVTSDVFGVSSGQHIPRPPKPVGPRGRPKGSTRANGYKVSSGRPVGTTRDNGYRVSTGRPSGTTRVRGCKVSPGRPKKDASRQVKTEFSMGQSDAGIYLPIQVTDISPSMTVVPAFVHFFDGHHPEYL